MYYPDLSPYEYTDGTAEECLRTVNVGWLAGSRPFPVGDVPKDFVAILRLLAQRPVNMTRGYHACDFCLAEIRAALPADAGGIVITSALESAKALGNGEVRAIGPAGACYHAPTLIVHYVEKHSYQPPQEFIDAVMAMG